MVRMLLQFSIIHGSIIFWYTLIVKLSRGVSCERESVDVLKLEDFMFLSLLGFQAASSLTSPKKL